MGKLVAPGGVKVLHHTTRSCRHKWADKLSGITSSVTLEELKKIGAGSEAFDNLRAYAERHQIDRLEIEDIVRYFATEHIADAVRSVPFSAGDQAAANQFAGKLVANCVLWFLDDDGVMRLADREIRISGAEDFGGEGVLCLHRHGLFRLPLADDLVSELRSQQAESSLFLAALDTLGGKLDLPLVPANARPLP